MILMPHITLLYAALLTVLLLALIFRIVYLRWTLRIGIGDGGDRVMVRAVRAHGNFIETAPWALVLMLLVEMTGAATVPMLHVYGCILLAGRCLHAYGVSRSGGPSFGRMAGIILTLLTFMAGAMLCAKNYFL
ncbi:MAG: putative rane protein [Micavibrio sp.]|nr:putative rane protein [Micavibrio sp.]